MHILHIISTLDPAAGGPAEGVRLLLSQTDSGCTGEVVTLDAPDAACLQDLRFPAHGLGPIRSVYGYHARLYPWLRANRDRFDGFLLNGMWQYCGLATMLAAGRHTPYMVFAHGMLDPYFKRRFPMKHLKKVLYWYPVEYWVLRRAHRVLFTTDTERELAEQSFALFRWKPAIVPYGVQVPDLPPTEMMAAFHSTATGLRGKRFLLFLGRIDPKKGCDMLVQAFCDAAAADPALHLVMAGPDRDGWSQELQHIADRAGCADRVHWPGMLRGPAKWGAFLASEAFVLPSHQENFGIAVAEALSCGRPVLLSDQVNLAATIREDGCTVIEPDTLDGTRRLLEGWIGLSPAERDTMKGMALLCSRRRFDLGASVRKIRDLFATAGKKRQQTLRDEA
ncbi:MAG: glycosyltransferase [Janthinobacterium lividum]